MNLDEGTTPTSPATFHRVLRPCRALPAASAPLAAALLLAACDRAPEASPATERPAPVAVPSGSASPPAAEAGFAGEGPKLPGQQGNAEYMRTVTDGLRRAGAGWDGAAITAVEPAGPCQATIRTAAGTARIRWADLGNLAPTDDDAHVTIAVPAGAAHPHLIVMRSGEDADRMIGALGLLDEACGGV